MLYLLYKIGISLALALPPAVSYRIADTLGGLYYLLAKRDKKIVKDNLKVVLNHSGKAGDLDSISRQIFINFARYLTEFFRSAKMNLQSMRNDFVLQGKENLDSALASGKGVLLVSAHVGNWEWGAMYLALLGYKINVIAWTHQEKGVNDFFLQQRVGKGVKVIPLGMAVRGVFSALKNNEIVAILGDIDYPDPQSGIKVQFFNRDTPMPGGPALFSLKTNAAIIPTIVVRQKDNSLKMILEKPIMYQASNNREEDLIALTQQVSQKVEHHISRYPSQWLMFHKRW